MKSQSIVTLILVVLTLGCGQLWAQGVDDFESYANTAAMQAAWIVREGCEPALSYSLNTSISHGGTKSVQYNYECDTAPYYSEILKVLSTPQDWSDYNALNFWLKGEVGATNSSEELVISLYSLVGSTYNDPNDLVLIGRTAMRGVLQNIEWQEFQANIEVGYGDRSAVQVIGIGFMPIYYGDGVVWIDDLELTTVEYGVLDNFETYANTTEMTTFGTSDGLGGGWRAQGTAVLTLSEDPDEHLGGIKAMKYDYNNGGASAGWSKAEKYLEWSSSLSGLDLRPYDYVVVNFKVTDASGYLMCKICNLNGTAHTIYYDEKNVLPVGDWVIWEIPVADIPTDISWAVRQIQLFMMDTDDGEGTYWNSGQVYFDDIHLNVCALDIAGDIDGNCRVNVDDLKVLAENWLDTGCIAETWCNKADIDQSGDVDLLDFAAVVVDWMNCNLLVQADCQ